MESQDKSKEEREISGVRDGGSGLKLAQNKILTEHLRNMRDTKYLMKNSAAR